MPALQWHAAVKTLVLRGYAGGSYGQRSKYAALVTVDLFGQTAVGSAMLRLDGQPLSAADFAAVAALVQQYGAQVMLAERHGRLIELRQSVRRGAETSAAPPATPTEQPGVG